MKKFLIFILAAILSLCALTACNGGNTGGGNNGDNSGNGGNEIVLPDLPCESDETEKPDESGDAELPELPNDDDEKQEGGDISNATRYTANTSISDVINDKAFSDWGRMIFPVNRGYYSGSTLGNLRLTWYNNINVAHTVEICNYFKDQTLAGNRVFYDIYTEAEKAADPRKADTGLFFFRGNKNAKFAVTCAGGGWAYVGAMHDSFPHAIELSKKGYNAFAIIYRPGAQTAYEDLARAITFIFHYANELGVDTNGYSVWGGSAGGRMTATISSYGVEQFGGGADIPKPSTAVIQYTGHSDYNRSGEPATFVTVGENYGIANYRTMKSRIDNIAAMGVHTEYHSYAGLGHGFGLGIGTIAEGWFDQAVAFWEQNS